MMVMMTATIVLIFIKHQILFYALDIHSLRKMLQKPIKSPIHYLHFIGENLRASEVEQTAQGLTMRKHQR